MTKDWKAKERLSLELRASGPRHLSATERDLIYGFPWFVGLPDGRGAHLVHVLEGRWLTQRVRTPSVERAELWVSSALAPLVTVLVQGGLPLASGGTVQMAEYFHPALIGPPGWLPDVPVGGLVGLRLMHGVVEVAAVQPPSQPLAEQQRLRELLSRHLRSEQEFYDDGDGTNKRFALTAAVGSAMLEDPQLLVEPWLPLDELLQDPLREQHRQHWRDAAAAWQEGSVSFGIADMPEALYGELNRRAHAYGMSFDQYVVAVLGHLAWRTPFAEDLGPWESWVPASEEPQPPARLHRVP